MKLASLLLLLPCLAVVGCGASPHSDKPTGDVVVKILFGGEPVTEGVVGLNSSATGLGGSGNLDSTGLARISGIPVGEYTVIVNPPEMDPVVPGVTPEPTPAPKSDYANLPIKFRRESTTTLKLTVEKGKTDYEFDLKE